jgi:hypothetical protein
MYGGAVVVRSVRLEVLLATELEATLVVQLMGNLLDSSNF